MALDLLRNDEELHDLFSYGLKESITLTLAMERLN